jgi:hypothetical protein
MAYRAYLTKYCLVPHTGGMNAVQQTARIDSSRRHLWLDNPLPESISSGQVTITIIARDAVPAASPVGERLRKIWRGDAPWLQNPIETTTPFIPLTREEAHARQPFR